MAVPPFNQYRFNREKTPFTMFPVSSLSSFCALAMQFQIIPLHLHVCQQASKRQSLYRKDKLLCSIKKVQIFFDLKTVIEKENKFAKVIANLFSRFIEYMTAVPCTGSEFS